MSKVLSFDIETKNLSYEIGGWDNTHLFKVACITTWDGNKGVIYVDEPLQNIRKAEEVQIKPLREFKFDIDNHFQKGGILLGHNINAFDLPVLRDSMDIYIVRKYLEDKSNRCIDTSAYLVKEHGNGQENGIVKYFDEENNEFIELNVEW